MEIGSLRNVLLLVRMGKTFPKTNELKLNKNDTRLEFSFKNSFTIQFPETTMTKIDNTTVVLDLPKTFIKRLSHFNQMTFDNINKVWREEFNEPDFDINVIFDPCHDLQTFTIVDLPENLPNSGILTLLCDSIIVESKCIFLHWKFQGVVDLDTTDDENWIDETTQ
jgi:hypothetical protein